QSPRRLCPTSTRADRISGVQGPQGRVRGVEGRARTGSAVVRYTGSVERSALLSWRDTAMLVLFIDAEQYPRLLQTAHERGVKVIGFEIHEGYCVYRVSSSSDPEGLEAYHTVQCPDGEPLRLSCNCIANWVYGKACTYMAVVIEMLIHEDRET